MGELDATKKRAMWGCPSAGTGLAADRARAVVGSVTATGSAGKPLKLLEAVIGQCARSLPAEERDNRRSDEQETEHKRDVSIREDEDGGPETLEGQNDRQQQHAHRRLGGAIKQRPPPPPQRARQAAHQWHVT